MTSPACIYVTRGGRATPSPRVAAILALMEGQRVTLPALLRAANADAEPRPPAAPAARRAAA